jgi:hypothetical protein
MDGTVDTAVAMMIPGPHAKTACNARRIKGLVIDIDRGITVPE